MMDGDPHPLPELNGEPATPLSDLVGSVSSAAAEAIRLSASNLSLVRNFQPASSIPAGRREGIGAKIVEEGRPTVTESERDGRIGIDLKFGSITFKEHDDRVYAEALVDVIVGTTDMAPESDTRVQMAVRIKADPEVDPVLHVTERCRSQIVATLRAAADALDATSSRSLLFEGWKKPA